MEEVLTAPAHDPCACVRSCRTRGPRKHILTDDRRTLDDRQLTIPIRAVSNTTMISETCDGGDPSRFAEQVSRWSETKLRNEMSNCECMCQRLALDASREKIYAGQKAKSLKLKQVLGEDLEMLPSLSKLVTCNAFMKIIRHELHERMLLRNRRRQSRQQIILFDTDLQTTTTTTTATTSTTTMSEIDDCDLPRVAVDHRWYQPACTSIWCVRSSSSNESAEITRDDGDERATVTLAADTAAVAVSLTLFCCSA